MAIAEDVRNLFKEFGGRVESYVEFDHYVGTRRSSGMNEPPARARTHGEAQPETPAEREPKVDQPLGAVFARLAGRTPDK